MKKLTRSQKIQNKNFRMIENRISKITNKLGLTGESMNNVKAVLLARTAPYKTDKQGKVSRKYTSTGVKKVDKLVKLINSKKWNKLSDIKKSQRILGGMYSDLKSKLQRNDMSWKEAMKNLNKSGIGNLLKRYFGADSDWYFENRDLIIQYNNAEDSQQKKKLGDEVSKSYNDSKTKDILDILND